MISLVLDRTGTEHSSLLRWVVPASVALHVLVFAWLPSSQRAAFNPAVSIVVEMVEPPPASPPPPPPPPPSEESSLAAQVPAPLKAAATPSSTRATSSERRAAESQATDVVESESPVDFTSAVFSNDGPGIAIAGGGGRASGPATASAPGTARAAPPPPPRVVPPSALARLPRAPGLDAELERRYPAAAKRSGISGTAVLRVRILPDGRVGEAHVVSESFDGFGLACERTVRAARWEPPIDREGAPVTTEITYTCRFEVRS